MDEHSKILSTQTILLFIAATLFTCIIIEFIPKKEASTFSSCPSANYTGESPESAVQIGKHQPKYAIYTNGKGEDHLVHVIAVLDRIGYQRTSIESMEWDIMWAHDYPFNRLKPLLSRLKSHQKINHFPGMLYISIYGTLCV